jgi:hypothetical protein
MKRKDSIAFAAIVPIWDRFFRVSNIHLDHVRFVGSFGRQIEKELRFQMSGRRTLNEWLLSLANFRNRRRHVVVSDISDPGLPALIRSIESDMDFARSCVGYFAATFRTENVSRKEDIGKRFRLVHETFPHPRIFSDLDYEQPKALPQWPLVWKDNRLTLEQKQIVWELSRNWIT